MDCTIHGLTSSSPDPDATAAGDDDVTRASGPSTPLGTGPSTSLRAGDVLLDRYRVVGELGRGGMGVVYRADDLRLGQPVALKFLPPELARDARRLEQFHNEVRTARTISHANVCKVYDIGDVDGRTFLSMEYIEGEDLSAVLRRGDRFSEHDAVDLSRQICAGLAAVHDRGVLHRDLKPANIMLSKVDGGLRVRLMDFGLAETAGAAEAREGTPAYMAPEQLVSGEATARSDIYALGLVMHELFTGTRAIQGGSLDDVVRQHTSGDAAAAATAAGAISRSAQRAVIACLDRDPDKRPASAAAVAAMLQIVLLDDKATVGRWIQVGLPIVGTLLLMNGYVLFRSQAGSRTWSALMMLLGMAVIASVFRYSLKWTVTYKGHRIVFLNHPMWGERLYIDDVLVDRGRPGVNIRLRGTIESGDGAGERITSESRAALLSFKCRIVAEAFLPGR